ncbi:hypothetical protein Stsp01_40400 [Streptomyces sp. NBRC 13847]|uniref:integrase n=1 Tax=Streptomyces TaxID=1883 RepID=UPI0024A5655E|nr:integrase [Streptomyces sp. NBRC 13847]GLW17297.1 hypothetical protein Stsp01_40400 [Streptomyces sp. NBRC 13847]
MTDLFERLVTAFGLPPIRPHNLRHGTTTLTLAAEIAIKIVSYTATPASRGTTMQSVLPQVGKSADEATAKLAPLQHQTKAEKAVRKAAKNEKAKLRNSKMQVPERPAHIAHASHPTAPGPWERALPRERKTPGHA